MSSKAEKETKALEAKRRKEQEKVGEMSFLDHLEELRWHIIRSLIAVFVLAIVAFIIRDFIFQEIIFKPKESDFFTNRMFQKMADYLGKDALAINRQEIELINIKMPGQFNMSIWAAIVAGLIMAAPVVFWEFWKFIKPALYENEKKVATGAVFYTTFLFIIGVLFGYYLIVPLTIQFFGNYSISPEVTNQINITSYISMVISVVFASGVVFLLPVFSYSLSKVGLLTPGFMRTYRRHAIVLLVALAAVITPPDIFSQIMVAIPLILLYEVSIFISGRVAKNAEKKERAASKTS
ncbi:MAG TPA: twin-arginine translocase subunit TatC [Prolixibacteraceae bacterium]|nr:twin-arginine translocase subunit TatC [Prolixibacteraceae bacterium]HOR99244.1 twin-arginine translocase subunit TatC [Prolixibacteraceae bacterium]HOS90084.1 twin-arginine translocase subunit TatC [Prolixibacteraceae bacterium]HPL44159.1 twin-arginine translocase subunit TatC [Prolixibacteraceae bacterium]HQE52100.1 twin-arginine translocase subunit TatC [Prolixibacteraceae bacterium]